MGAPRILSVKISCGKPILSEISTAPVIDVEPKSFPNIGFQTSDNLIAKVGVNSSSLPSPVKYGAGFQFGLEYQMSKSLAIEFMHAVSSSTEVSYYPVLTNNTLTREVNSLGLNIGF
jgi:hypothetical protein